MAQILDPLPSSDDATVLLCCYVNVTSKIQIARITNISDWYFERVVFPGQRLLFEAPPSALLEIHTGMMASAILSDSIPCDRIAIDENGNQIAPPSIHARGHETTHGETDPDAAVATVAVSDAAV